MRPGTPTSLVTDTSFHWNYQPAVAAWAGWAAPNGLGLRARYFFEGHSSDIAAVNLTTTAPPQTTINPPLGNFLPLSTGGTAFGSPGTVLNNGIGTDQLTFGSDLWIHAIDIEATRGIKGAGWSLLLSAGGRYQILDQGYHGRLVNNGGGAPVTEVQTLDSTRNFNGGGPVLGFEGSAKLGNSNLSVYGSLHGAFLVGVNTEIVQLVQTVVDPTGLIPGSGGGFQINPQAMRTTEHVLTVAEMEVGVQYDLQSYNAFVRLGVVNHTYFDAGNASQSTGDMSLFGVQFSAGIKY